MKFFSRSAREARERSRGCHMRFVMRFQQSFVANQFKGPGARHKHSLGYRFLDSTTLIKPVCLH